MCDCTVKMVVSAEQQKQYLLLRRLRIRRAERERGYRDLVTFTAIFNRQHKFLVEARAALSRTKFSTRLERRKAAEHLSESELKLPLSRAHVIRQARHLRSLIHREVSLCLEVLAADLPGTTSTTNSDTSASAAKREDTTMPVQNVVPYPDSRNSYLRGLNGIKNVANSSETASSHAFWGEHIPSLLDTFNAKYGVEIFCPSPPPVETVKHDAESVYYDSSGPVNVVEGSTTSKDNESGSASVRSVSPGSPGSSGAVVTPTNNQK